MKIRLKTRRIGDQDASRGNNLPITVTVFLAQAAKPTLLVPLLSLFISKMDFTVVTTQKSCVQFAYRGLPAHNGHATKLLKKNCGSCRFWCMQCRYFFQRGDDPFAPPTFRVPECLDDDRFHAAILRSQRLVKSPDCALKNRKRRGVRLSKW